MKTCSIPGCDLIHYAKNMCRKHWERNHFNGTPHLRERITVCQVDGCNNRHEALGFCSKHYTRYRSHGDVEVTMRFVGDNALKMKKYSIVDSNGCWVWQRNIYLGYGKTFINGKPKSAHRASWEIFVGQIPVGKQINHKCHNRRCINPEHLYVGTQKQNVRDMYESNRNNTPLGSKQGQSKLVEEDIPLIRKKLAEHVTIVQIARDFGVSESCIRSIRNNLTWKHV